MEFFFLGILGCCLHFRKSVSSSPPEGVLIIWVIYSLLHPFRRREQQLSPSPDATVLHAQAPRSTCVDSLFPSSQEDSYLLLNLMVGQV